MSSCRYWLKEKLSWSLSLCFSPTLVCLWRTASESSCSWIFILKQQIMLRSFEKKTFCSSSLFILLNSLFIRTWYRLESSSERDTKKDTEISWKKFFVTFSKTQSSISWRQTFSVVKERRRRRRTQKFVKRVMTLLFIYFCSQMIFWNVLYVSLVSQFSIEGISTESNMNRYEQEWKKDCLASDSYKCIFSVEHHHIL